MQRFTLLALVLLLLGCNSGEFKPVLHQELKGDGGIQAWLSTLRGMTNGAARTSVKMQMRNAQSQMRSIRQNAQIDGVHILASPWETASVPYGLDD